LWLQGYNTRHMSYCGDIQMDSL